MARAEAILVDAVLIGDLPCEEKSEVEKGGKARAKTLTDDCEWSLPKDECYDPTSMNSSQWFVCASFVYSCSCTGEEQKEGPHTGDMEVHEQGKQDPQKCFDREGE